jgi:glutathione peroxidase-family protein
MLETNIELTMQDGSARSTADFAGKLVMVVNVASRCGLTPQYEALENSRRSTKTADLRFWECHREASSKS